MDWQEASLESLRRAHFDTAATRLHQLLEARDLDALVLLRNDGTVYLNTYPSVFIDNGFQGQAAIAVVRDRSPFGVCMDFDLPGLEAGGMIEEWLAVPSWVCLDRSRIATAENESPAPAPFGQASPTIERLAQQLKGLGLGAARCGIELGSLTSRTMDALRRSLPEATWTDIEHDLDVLRSKKTPYELSCLRHAAKMQWEVVPQVMAGVRPGTSFREIASEIRARASRCPGIEGVRFLFLYVGHNCWPSSWSPDVCVRAGDLVTIDLGFVCRGYISDSARTFVMGEPTPEQRRIQDIFMSAHDAALELYRPGTPLRAIFECAHRSISVAGLPKYRRGHTGHGLGLNDYVEEWPWVDDQSQTVLEPSNVMTLELPYYAFGFGTYMDEDIVHVTESGHELLTPYSRGLHVLSS